MKKILLLILCTCISSNLFSQEGWMLCGPTISNHLYSVSFINKDTGYVLGLGIILKTTDGGLSWNSIYQEEYYYSIFFNDVNTGYCAGSSIIKTTDAGETWVTQIDSTNFLYDIFFINGNVGWAVGTYGTILKTTNDGDTWTPKVSGTDLHLSSVYLVNIDTGFVVGWGWTSWFAKYF